MRSKPITCFAYSTSCGANPARGRPPPVLRKRDSLIEDITDDDGARGPKATKVYFCHRRSCHGRNAEDAKGRYKPKRVSFFYVVFGYSKTYPRQRCLS